MLEARIGRPRRAAGALALGLAAWLAPAAVGGQDDPEAGAATVFTLRSASFSHRGEIPSRFTCEGAGVSPALSWSGLPEGT